MKKLFLTLSVFAVSYMANAAYLYWQLDDTGYEGQYSDVQISDGNGGTVEILGPVWSEELGDYEIGTIAASDVQAGTTYLIDESSINTSDGYSYYIELMNSGNRVNTDTTPISGSEFSSYASNANVSSDLTDLAGGEVAVWHASSGGMSVIPEPTSAILMMFGMAFLGLKRKNRSIA